MRKNSLYLLIGLLAISFAFTSCLDDDDTTYELTSDAAITNFSIGDIAMKDTIKTKDGSKDSIVYYNLSTVGYKFTIDQARGMIYNADSLPVGTDITKVAVDTLTLSYGYYVTYVKNGQDTVWTTTDSIDFTKPVTFKAYALNGGIRQYQVKISVHRQDPDSLQWNRMEASGLEIPAGADHKAVCCQGRMYIFAQTNGGELQVNSSADGLVWDGWQTASLTGEVKVTSVLALDDRFYILSDDKLYTSVDGQDWQVANDSRTFSRLFAASPKLGELYAVSESEILALSKDGSVLGGRGIIDDSFPKQNLSYMVSTTRANGDVERLTLVGTHLPDLANDTTAVVWSKLSNEDSWTYYPQASNNTLGCPKLKNLATIAYDGKLYAFGGDYDIPASQARPEDFKPFKYMYESVDGGLGWRPRTSKVMLPAAFLNRSADFSYLVDDDDFIWIFWSPSEQTENRTEVWRGKINRLGF